VSGPYSAPTDISFGFVVSQEMMMDLYMFCTRVTDRVVCKLYGTFIVTQKWDMGEVTSVILWGLLHPK
jgi:hypothetical protein